jgi:hypothetical protein
MVWQKPVQAEDGQKPDLHEKARGNPAFGAAIWAQIRGGKSPLFLLISCAIAALGI